MARDSLVVEADVRRRQGQAEARAFDDLLPAREHRTRADFDGVSVVARSLAAGALSVLRSPRRSLRVHGFADVTELRRHVILQLVREFAHVAREPHRRREALQLLLLIANSAEKFYTLEESSPSAHHGSQEDRRRQARRNIVADLRGRFNEWTAQAVQVDAFALLHATDALLVHEFSKP